MNASRGRAARGLCARFFVGPGRLLSRALTDGLPSGAQIETNKVFRQNDATGEWASPLPLYAAGWILWLLL